MEQQNAIISNDGHALLCDFSLSSLATSTFSITVNCPHRGSIPWMAPEHLDSDLMPTYAIDVWAFGVTILLVYLSRIDRFSLGPNKEVLRGGVTVLREGAGILARGTGSCT